MKIYKVIFKIGNDNKVKIGKYLRFYNLRRYKNVINDTTIYESAQ